MIALDTPRQGRDVDIVFDFRSNGSRNNRSYLAPDPKNELNMSVHRRRPKRRGRARTPAPSGEAGQEQRNLGIRFIYDQLSYPAAFVVEQVFSHPKSVAWDVAKRGKIKFGIGSRLIGLNGRNVAIMKERELATLLQETVARATFASMSIQMRFDNIELTHDVSQGSKNLSLWGQVALSSFARMSSRCGGGGDARRPNTAAAGSGSGSKRSPTKNTKEKDKWDPVLHGMKPSKHKPRNQTRYGSGRAIGGNFTKSKRYRDLEMVHTGTQANASSFKKQPLSTSRSSPGFSIGLSTREDWKRVGFQGVAKTADSGSSPQFSCLGLKGGAADFGASERQLPPFKGIDPGFDSPGPAAYPEKYGMGPGSLSMAPSPSMGAGKRNTLATNQGLDSPVRVLFLIFPAAFTINLFYLLNIVLLRTDVY